MLFRSKVLQEIIDSNTYELNKSFTTLWDPDGVWNKESIWVEVLDEGDKWGSWGPYNSGAHLWIKYYAACPSNGGWGALFLSWEWYSSFEKGDKRRDGSACTAPVPNIESEWQSDVCYGFNPYTKENVNPNAESFYKFETGGEMAPSIWSLKFWRTARPGWSGDQWAPGLIFWKRLPAVMFDLAECLFRLNGENDQSAWALVEEVRNRAFGNLEVGNAATLTNIYLPYYQKLAGFYSGDATPFPEPNEYPIPFNTDYVSVPDARTYYTQVKAEKGFTLPVWQVALGMERRKEFNCEWNLRPDLQRSGFMAEHIEYNYPKGVGTTGANARDNWHTVRNHDFNEKKLDMPIPTEELLKNPLCDQNEAYR